MGVLALTNNMITFTFFQSKITLSFALFQKCFSESAAKTLDSLGKVLYNGCDSFEKVLRTRFIRLKKCRIVIFYIVLVLAISSSFEIFPFNTSLNR